MGRTTAFRTRDSAQLCYRAGGCRRYRVVVEETSTLLKDNQGNINGRSIIYRDITQRIQLEEKLHRHIADLSVINEINDALLSTMDLNEVLGIILIGVTAAQGLGFNRAFLLLIDQQEQALVGKMAIGPSNAWEAGIIWNELYQKRQTLRELLDSYKSSVIKHDIHVNEVVRKIHIPLTDTENQLVRCVLEKKSLNIQRGDQENHLPGWLVNLLGIDTMAMVPMVMKEISVGLLLADNMINQKPISDDSVRMLRVFANLASQAIENSRLYMSLEEKIADLDAAYTQLKKSRDRLVRAERLSAVGEVATNLAHEIRNPLVSVGGFARALQKELGKDDPRREKVRIIIEEVDRLERFLKNTMAFAKPMVPNFKPKDPNKLIQQTFMMMDQELEHSGVEIALKLMDNPPLVELDKDQVRQVLLNIFRNGLEAMPEGGCLTVSTRSENGMFIISVADTGVGIEQADMEQLFTAFFTTKSTGSGLGLSISRQIIKNHGGTIGFSSRKGEGTVFHITLPITHQAAMKEDQ